MTALQPRVLLGLDWAGGAPRVRLRDSDAETSSLVSIDGLRLNYRASPASARHCIGRREVNDAGSRYVDCRRSPRQGERTCTTCAVAEASFASNLHHAHTKQASDPAFAAHLRKPTVLYLAAFRDGSLKIGTSTSERRADRLAEQGAWAARVVAQLPDGIVVRRLEDRITAELGIAQAVSPSRKLDGMVAPVPEGRLAAELDERVAPVRALVASDVPTGVQAPVEAWRHPHADSGWWNGLHRYPIDLATGTHDLEILDVVGRIVAVRRPSTPDDVFVADLGRLFGIELDLGNYQSDELAVQDSLF